MSRTLDTQKLITQTVKESMELFKNKVGDGLHNIELGFLYCNHIYDKAQVHEVAKIFQRIANDLDLVINEATHNIEDSLVNLQDELQKQMTLPQ